MHQPSTHRSNATWRDVACRFLKANPKFVGSLALPSDTWLWFPVFTSASGWMFACACLLQQCPILSSPKMGYKNGFWYFGNLLKPQVLHYASWLIFSARLFQQSGLLWSQTTNHDIVLLGRCFPPNTCATIAKENAKNTSSKSTDASDEFKEFNGKEFSAGVMTGLGALSFGTLPLASLFWSALLVWNPKTDGNGGAVFSSARRETERKIWTRGAGLKLRAHVNHFWLVVWLPLFIFPLILGC